MLSNLILFICSHTTQKMSSTLHILTYVLQFNTNKFIILGNKVVIKLHYNFSIRCICFEIFILRLNMIKKVFYSLILIIVSLSTLQSQELEKKARITREFTVTSLALDAQEARLQIQEDEDNNNTNTQGGLAIEN